MWMKLTKGLTNIFFYYFVRKMLFYSVKVFFEFSNAVKKVPQTISAESIY